MRVSVAGMGYVGLVSGACLAELGHEVVCADIDASKVKKVNRGEPPFREPELEALLRRNLGKRLWATVDLTEAVARTELTLISVGTPFDGGRIDLTAVCVAAREIGAALGRKPGLHVVVVKSTVVPGTTETTVRAVLEVASGRRAGEGFGLAMNPEFLTEGQAVEDFLNPDRIVLGALDARSLEALEALYASFPDALKLRTNPRTAELIKYGSNALLATAISFANELANLCAAVGGADVVEVMRGVHAMHELNPVGPGGDRARASLTSFLQAGCGFGGSCLPKDVKALVAHGEGLGVPMRLLRAVLEVNEAQPSQVLRALERRFPDLEGARVGVLGLAFKPGTDDVRGSPSIGIVRSLLRRGAVVTVFDPVATDEARKLLGDEVSYAHTLQSCLEGEDAVVLLTRWKEFEAAPALLAAMASPPLLVDGRRQLEKAKVPHYAGIGLSG